MQVDNSPPPRGAFGRAWEDFDPVTEPERKLAEAARMGEFCVIGMVAPETGDAANSIRAEFLRFLALGGDQRAPVHEKGLRLQGAFVAGALNLEGAELPFDLYLFKCRFAAPIMLRGTRGRTVNLGGTKLQGLSGDRLRLDGGLFLRGTQVTGELRLLGARIGGNLECIEGRFDNAGGDALSCDGAEIGGSVFLSSGFHATGATRLLGAQIGGVLECIEGRFDNAGGDALNCDRAEIGGSVFLSRGFHATGESRLLGARIAGILVCIAGRFDNPSGDALSCDRAEIGGSMFFSGGFHATGVTRLPGAQIAGDLDCSQGQFDNADGYALVCDGVEIAGALLFRGAINVLGTISVAHAQVGTLADAPECWPDKSLDLDGFRYQRIAASAPLDAKTRIAWLDKQPPPLLAGKNFALQPWMHLAKALREQGHFSEAAEVDIAREDRLRNAGRIAPLPSPGHWWAYLMTPVNECAQRDPAFSTGAQAKLLPNIVLWVLHWFYGFSAGYGYKPFRVIAVAFFAWLAFAAFYGYAASRAVFGPSNALVFQNKAYEHCRPDAPAEPENGKAKTGNWTRCPDVPGEYTSFSSLAYSADLILPVVSLGQSNDWSPITSGDGWSLGYVTRCLVWFEELLGWVAALTLAAIASGLVKRKDGD
jgi:hypothetical protein